MIVMDESSCMVDVAKYFMDFCMTESCGKCVPCRVGTYQMHRILDAITKLTATPRDLGHAGRIVRSAEEHEPVRPRPVGAQPGLSTLSILRTNTRRTLKSTSVRPEFAASSR